MTQDEKKAENGVDRREFLKFAGTGLVVFLGSGSLEAFQHTPSPNSPPTDFNAYLRIGPDNRVGFFVGKVEVGQGLMTSLPQLLAEELDVDYDSVDIVAGDTDLCPWDIGTFGSLAQRELGPLIRASAAEARAVLLQMAAERFLAPVGRLRVASGAISDPVQGKRVTYGELVQGKLIERHLDNVPLKSPKDFKVIGKSPARRRDAIEKVTGKARYAGDIAVPGVVCARLLRPPAHGAKLKSVDTSAAEKIPGVRVVRDGDFIAVIHERFDVADKALELIKAEFDPSPIIGLDENSIFDHLVKNAPKPQLVVEKGDIAQGEKLGRVFEQTYYHGYGAHGAIETQTTLVAIEGAKATVWAATSMPFLLRNDVARTLGFAPENVRVIAPYVGGNFGGRNHRQNGIEAARLAKLVGKPVQLIWDRAEDFFYDRYRPAAVVKIRSTMTGEGRIVAWDYKVYAAGEWGSIPFYDFPNQRVVAAPEAGLAWRRMNTVDGLHPFNVGPWRMPSAVTNAFARESHLDTLASQAGVDPVEFRMRHLSNERIRRVLQTAAKQFGWRPGRTPSRRGVGVACSGEPKPGPSTAGNYKTVGAAIAEIEVDTKTGEVQVRRVVNAVDAGIIVNPEGARQQVEGCITMALGCALTEEVLFRNGEILVRNFDSYQLPRFSNIPKMEVVLIDNPELAPDGIGEPPIVAVGPAIANAIFDATGARLLQLPMTPARVKEALSSI
jgi:isoquinoline 1-oxidoreductase